MDNQLLLVIVGAGAVIAAIASRYVFKPKLAVADALRKVEAAASGAFYSALMTLEGEARDAFSDGTLSEDELIHLRGVALDLAMKSLGEIGSVAVKESLGLFDDELKVLVSAHVAKSIWTAE